MLDRVRLEDSNVWVWYAFGISSEAGDSLAFHSDQEDKSIFHSYGWCTTAPIPIGMEAVHGETTSHFTNKCHQMDEKGKAHFHWF